LIANSKDNLNLTTVAAAYKRINNILKKSEVLVESLKIEQSLFEFEEESFLYNLYLSRSNSIAALISDREWQKVLSELEAFAEPLDSYFSKVMVMHDDLNIRNNRLASLALIRKLFKSTGLT
jgi:glycyl-tRNA synthetase beta chain